MKYQINYSQLSESLRVRNLTIAVAVMLLIATCIQSIVIFYLAGREKIIIVPPQLEQTVWLKGDKASRSYLEQMTLFFSSLALNVTPDNAAFKHQKLLRFIDPRIYSALKTKLAKDADVLKKRNISTVFQPVNLAINKEHLITEIEGDFITLVGQTQTSAIRKKYRTRFVNRQGQWFISEFREITHEQE